MVNENSKKHQFFRSALQLPQPPPRPPAAPPSPEYKNSLLAAVAYLDLANTLDFPANVWNEDPLPTFAKVLMGAGGSITILTTYFAFWDMVRSWENVKVLRAERAYLSDRRGNEKRSDLVEDAWLGVNYRELGWELIDRMMMDAFMAVAGILVGTGCLMAIRGDIPTVFLASNVLSGYLGNSFVAAYGLINAMWSLYMWRKAHVNEIAVARHQDDIDGDILMELQKHARRHKIYALVNGISVLIAGIASEISSTMWPGYVVLIPCIAGSVFCNYFWRYCLGYDRSLFQSRSIATASTLVQQLRILTDVCQAYNRGSRGSDSIEETVAACIQEKRGEVLDGILTDLAAAQIPNETASTSLDVKVATQHQSHAEQVDALSSRIRSIGKQRFQHETRFLLELYGYCLAASDLHAYTRNEAP